MSVELFVEWETDSKNGINALARANSEDLARRVNQTLDHANMFLENWIISHGGSVVVNLGDSGSFRMPSNFLEDFIELVKKYEGIISGKFYAGIGSDAREAAKALEYATKDKTDQTIALYEEDMEHEDEPESKDESGLGDLLSKSWGLAQPGEASKIEAGKLNPMEAKHKAPDLVSADFKSVREDGPAPVDIENAVDGEGNGEDSDSSEESDQDSKTGSDDEESSGKMTNEKPDTSKVEDRSADEENQKIKEMIAKVVREIKSQMPIIEQMKTNNPTAFKAVTNLVTAFIKVAKQVLEPKEDSEIKDVAKSEINKIHRSASEKSGIDESDVDSEELEEGTEHEQSEHGLDKKSAKKIAMDHLAEDPHYYKKMNKKQLDATPVGTVVGRKMKIKEDVYDGGDGKKKNASAASGVTRGLNNEPRSVKSSKTYKGSTAGLEQDLAAVHGSQTQQIQPSNIQTSINNKIGG